MSLANSVADTRGDRRLFANKMQVSNGQGLGDMPILYNGMAC